LYIEKLPRGQTEIAVGRRPGRSSPRLILRRPVRVRAGRIARINNAATAKLSALLTTGVTEISYIYDIGDNWQHRIIVEKLKPAEPGALYPQFLGGERRCPPEDCGGFPGYCDFLDNIASKQSKKRKAALNWYGRPYVPGDIDEQQIIINLKSIANPRRPGRSKAVKT
jgi:hypothetical protein